MAWDTPEGPDAPPGHEPRDLAFERARDRAERWLRGADDITRQPSPAEEVLERIDSRNYHGNVKQLAILLALYEQEGLHVGISHPRHPNPQCHECGALLTESEDRAEVYLNPDYLRDQAGGQHVLVDDIPEEQFGPFLVHADPCYTSHTDKYGLA